MIKFVFIMKYGQQLKSIKIKKKMKIIDEIYIKTNLIPSNKDNLTTNEISIQSCHDNCKECTEFSSDDKNMKCISCKMDLV